MGNAAGEVSDCIHLLRLQKLGLQPQALCKIAAVGDEVRDLSRCIPHRADAFLHVIEFAVLLPVHQDAAIDIARANGFPHLLVKLNSLLARFQNSRGLAEYFVVLVAGESLERRIDIFNNPAEVGYDDRVGRLLDRP